MIDRVGNSMARSHMTEVRLLSPTDLNDLLALHEAAIEERVKRNVGNLIGRHDANYFEENLSSTGFIFGAFCESKLIGYCSARAPATTEENFGHHLGLEANDLGVVMHLNGAYICPGFRGKGLHVCMADRRKKEAHRRGFKHLLVEAHKNNHSTLVNQFRSNMVVRSITMDGPDEYLLLHYQKDRYTNLRTEVAFETASVGDVSVHRRLISQGLVGIRLSRYSGSFCIEYVRDLAFSSSHSSA